MGSKVCSDFVAVMCHEIRAPLSGILGFAELLETVGSLSERQARYVSAIKTGGQRLAAMLDAVLDYAHPERGAESLQHRRFLPAEAVRKAVAEVEAEARDRGMVVRAVEEGPQRVVTADPDRFEYALKCLLSVLVKGAPRDSQILLAVKSEVDGCEVSIRLESGSEAGPRADWAAILTAYETPEATLAPTHRSLAFYTAVARRLVEMHGGCVKAGASDEPQLAFVVRLPDFSQRAVGG